ncbi:hypothetical protein MGG_00379 [Pyricularia oryzae 70-15]|uniref:C3H1-type domain-containing protein n=3 Tax=Pyricularia oryzae TaxID=318829 RepID=G4NCM0_PYRO7|nr:uncharacterized protein MGG_00379 [Pyricularia oryzae 70-15]EHA49114.1 hypothetical protein MGG_00379 [Pyricularia oryzae 70-15]ELQ35538.1 hypothetical protein OOU_Y34scaffold00704g5 [Pyricularia oryzae Y34]KAI7915033.1 hypothetical protein M0657_009216 [Pyricularia oryzae]KAI7924300.1 hypothetical protein M9X92_003917 [Pyricularia oryzae]
MAPLLQYYLVRPANKMQTASGYVRIPESKVPMIPVDILPEWIEIVGLPRSLRDDHAVGLTSLGHIEQPQDTLEVRIHRVDPLVHRRAVPHAHASHLSSGRIGASIANNMELHKREPVRVVPSDQLKTTTLGELKKQQPSHANQIIHTAAEEAPASSKHGPVAAPNDLSSPVHARPDLSVKMTTKAGSVPAASSFQDQQPSSRGLQLSGNEHMRKSMHGSRKKTKVPGARRFCHHWCHYGVCKWGAECHYHHAMPATREGLREVGLKDYPRWWAELSGRSMGSSQDDRTGQNAARKKTPSGLETRPHEPELQRQPVSRSRRVVTEDVVPRAANPSEELPRLRHSGGSGMAHQVMQPPAASSLTEGKNVVQKDGRREPATLTQKLVDLD